MPLIYSTLGSRPKLFSFPILASNAGDFKKFDNGYFCFKLS